MGTIEPVYVKGEPVRAEKDPADRMAFIRGCLQKYKGKGVPDSEILAYVERMVAWA